MGYEKKGGKNLNPEYLKTESSVKKEKRRHAHLIFNDSTYKKLRIYAMGLDVTLCELMEDIAEKFLREKGKF